MEGINLITAFFALLVMVLLVFILIITVIMQKLEKKLVFYN